MLADASGEKPKIGCEGGPGLGVREPPDPHADVHPDSAGIVETGRGMSVAPSIDAMLPHLIPKRLRRTNRDAKASNDKIVWSLGVGPFVDAVLNLTLVLRVTSDTHGQVEPAERMPLIDFQNALASTQNDWRKDEK